MLRPSVGGTIKLKFSIACCLRASATFPCGCGEEPLSFDAIQALAASMAGFAKLAGQARPLPSFLLDRDLCIASLDSIVYDQL